MVFGVNKHDSKPIPFEPLAVTKQQACILVASTKLVQRWLYWSTHAPSSEQGWLRVVRQGGRGTETIIDYASLKEAYYRFRNGDEPPLLPSEGRGKIR
jgi:hypothetical protein